MRKFFDKIKRPDFFLFWPIVVASILFPVHVCAFTKIQNGLETITETYLVPLAGAVAGASFVIFVIMSFFRQEEYQKKAANVAILSIFVGAGLELIKLIIRSFS